MYESALAGQTRCPCGSPEPADNMADMVEVKIKLHLHRVYCDLGVLFFVTLFC